MQNTTIQHRLNAAHHMKVEVRRRQHYYSSSKKFYYVYEPLISFLQQDRREYNYNILDMYVPVPPNLYENVDLHVFDECITHLLDLRKSKVWVKYMMSDNVVRCGTIQKHPVYTSLPGWLVDVLRLRRYKRLTLVWCTDLRGVDQYLGSLCSVINLHHLLRRLERQNGDNYTAILLQMTVLSTHSLNPVNRRGFKYPACGMTACTFEDVRRSLLKTQKNEARYDALEAPFTRIICAIPHKVGTNFFDVVVHK